VNDPVIDAKGLSKNYRIGLGGRYGRLSESLTNLFAHPIKSTRRARMKRESFWALKDVSFSARRGEVVGIIGRNGAGKSTLLKILASITYPSEGEVTLRGRVGSLLEVGTGFHPELTGRENIYLNGAILGLRRREINSRFDDIVNFAEIDKFIDTPIKRYSSGMYVRLAFAVAAQLSTEILLVDEVLAVGDARFQKKCLGRMRDISEGGRTVLFVSHNMGAISGLCSSGIFLEEGRIRLRGDIHDVVTQYMSRDSGIEGEAIWTNVDSAPGDSTIRIKSVRVVQGGNVTNSVAIDEDVDIEMEFWNLQAGAPVSSSIHLLDQNGVGVLASANYRSAMLEDDGWFGRPHPKGIFKTSCRIPGNFLNEGMYHVNAIVLTNVTEIHARVNEAVSFVVHDTGEMRKEYTGGWLGVVRPKLEWRTEMLTKGD